MNNGEFCLIEVYVSQHRSSLLLREDNTSNSKTAANRLEFSDIDYKENLRTMPMTSLISEMYNLRRELHNAMKEVPGSSLSERSPKFLEHKEAMVEKVLAVEIEIGRRLRAPK